MKISLPCRFCGIETGYIEIPDGRDAPDLSEAIADIRCTAHEQEHGSYKEMEKEYRRRFREGDFNKFMQKVGYKKSAFDAEMEKIKK